MLSHKHCHCCCRSSTTTALSRRHVDYCVPYALNELCRGNPWHVRRDFDLATVRFHLVSAHDTLTDEIPTFYENIRADQFDQGQRGIFAKYGNVANALQRLQYADTVFLASHRPDLPFQQTDRDVVIHAHDQPISEARSIL